MKLDILAIVAHPDDAELSCGGTLIKHSELGYKTGILDLTKGEMGTRGTPETRAKEAEKAAKILGLAIRENLGFKDGKFPDDEEHRNRIIEKIRQYQPEIILTNAPEDRHPDHGRAAKLVKEAAWLAGLKNWETTLDGQKQECWRPKHVYHFLQYNMLEPDLVVDIKGYVNKKMEAILAFSSQFYNPDTEESNTLISSPAFLEFIKARNVAAGNYALIEEGEAFISAYKPAVRDLFDLI